MHLLNFEVLNLYLRPFDFVLGSFVLPRISRNREFTNGRNKRSKTKEQREISLTNA